jgi:hypothetical protein
MSRERKAGLLIRGRPSNGVVRPSIRGALPYEDPLLSTPDETVCGRAATRDRTKVPAFHFAQESF